MSDTGQQDEPRSFVKRCPFVAFMAVVSAMLIATALAGYAGLAEHMYNSESGWSDIAPPVGLAISELREKRRVEPLTAQALLAALRQEDTSDTDGRPLVLKTGDESFPLTAFDIQDEYGRGVLLCYPLPKQGPVWRRRFGLGVIVYEGLERARNVRLYRYPDEEGFSMADIGESRHIHPWGFEAASPAAGED